MSEQTGIRLLQIVDGLSLPQATRAVYKPGEAMRAESGKEYPLPRFFYKVPDSQTAHDTKLTAHFDLWEFLIVDYKEHPLAAEYPRYVPCAVTFLAAALEIFRAEFNRYIHVAANGGYRSPSHQLSEHASPHCWGTAANIYRIGDDYLENREAIESYNRLAEKCLHGVWTRPYGRSKGFAEDHLHLDLGFSTFVPDKQQ